MTFLKSGLAAVHRNISLGGVIRWTVYATGIFALLELNQHTYLPVVNAEFDICVISCGKSGGTSGWWM